MNILIKFFTTFLFLSLTLLANEGTRTEKIVEVSGSGSSKTLAIQNALIEAVKQKNGAYVQSVKQAFRSNSNKYISNGEDSASLIKMNSAMNQQVKIATSGFIDNYQVINMVKDVDGYEATIRIVTVGYKAPGNSAHKRRKMVIVPSYTENLAFKVLNRTKTTRDVSYNLSQELTNAITQTRKFAILDRNNQNAYNNETAVIVSANAQKDEILKLGQVLGADYLVVSTIKEFKILKQKKMLKSVGQEVVKLKAFATVNYQILTMSTRQVKYSNTIDFEFKPKGNSDQQIFYNVLKKISIDLTNEIIENIYPIRIAKVSENGDAVLTQSAPLGSTYNVYSMGEKLFDPYTKEFLGYDEVKTGTIKIVRSLAKVAYGQVIEGQIQGNSICRKAKKISSKAQYSSSNQQSNSSNNNIQVKDPNAKKFIAIKPLSISRGIDRYKHKYIKDANIAVKIKNIVNKSKKYRVLTRDAEQAQAMMDENELSKSDLSDDMNEDSMKFSNVDYQLLPKVTKLKLSRSSHKLPNISVYENSDYAKMELNIVVLDRKGEVIFESTKSDTYLRKWTSNKKVKGAPGYSVVNKLAKKLTSKVLYDLLNEKAEMMSGKFITVVEVSGKTIYLDLGDNSDVQEGDEFPVYKEPKVKTIKRTGKTRLSYGDKIATVRVDGIYDDGAEAVVIKGKIRRIKEGYVLRVKKHRR